MTGKTLSKRAQALMARLHRGDFYPAHDAKTPRAMQELIDAGLVGTMGRVESIRKCYVPKGSKPFKMEVIKGAPFIGRNVISEAARYRQESDQ